MSADAGSSVGGMARGTAAGCGTCRDGGGNRRGEMNGGGGTDIANRQFESGWSGDGAGMNPAGMADGPNDDDNCQQTSGGQTQSRCREARTPQPSAQPMKLSGPGICCCARRGQAREDTSLKATRRPGIAQAAEGSIDGSAGAGIRFGMVAAVHR